MRNEIPIYRNARSPERALSPRFLMEVGCTEVCQIFASQVLVGPALAHFV